MKKSVLALNILSVVAAVGIVVTTWSLHGAGARAPHQGLPATVSHVAAVGAGAAAHEEVPGEAAVPVDVVLTKRPTAGLTQYEVNVEWVETFRDGMAVRGTLRVNQRDSEAPRQAFAFDLDGALPREQMALEFIDLTGDQFQDLVFTHSRGFLGMTTSDVYIWAPQLSKFVKSETLSGPGLLSAGSRPGCVVRDVNCSSNTHAEAEICFNQATGRWRTSQAAACIERE